MTKKQNVLQQYQQNVFVRRKNLLQKKKKTVDFGHCGFCQPKKKKRNLLAVWFLLFQQA